MLSLVIIRKAYPPNYSGIISQTVGFSLVVLPFRSPDKAKPVRVEADPPDF
jgi:hypothetical protein